jgi:hypothetical protein
VSAVTVKFRGGEKLKAHLLALQSSMLTARGMRVGFLEGSTYPATPGQGTLHVAQVAFWNEFGTSRAPARPFFRGMIRREEGGWGGQFADFLRRARFDAATALKALGITIKEELTDSIRTWPADNAPATVALKGFNKGLIASGVMQSATDFEVLS